jgi:hypothetical protein
MVMRGGRRRRRRRLALALLHEELRHVLQVTLGELQGRALGTKEKISRAELKKTKSFFERKPAM